MYVIKDARDPRRRLFARFDTDAVLRQNMLKRAERYHALLVEMSRDLDYVSVIVLYNYLGNSIKAFIKAVGFV